MVANKKITGRATSLPAGLVIGAVCSLAATLILTAILAKLVEAEMLPVEKIGYGIMALLMVSSFAGAMIAFGRDFVSPVRPRSVYRLDLRGACPQHRRAVQRRGDDRPAGSGGQRNSCIAWAPAGKGNKTNKN